MPTSKTVEMDILHRLYLMAHSRLSEYVCQHSISGNDATAKCVYALASPGIPRDEYLE